MRLAPATAALRRARPWIGLAGILGVALLAGCGGGGDDGPSEDALRSRLAAAFKKTDEARSIRILDSFEVGDEDDGETVAGCLDISVVKVAAEGPEAEDLVLRSLVDGCDHGSVTGEIAIIGSSFWVSGGDGRFKPGTIDTKLVPQLAEEGIEFGDLPGVGSDIELGDAPTGGAAAATGPTYEFEAPASALSDEVGVDSTELDFTATTDSRGFLTGLTAEIEVEGATGKVEQRYEEIDQVPPVRPPPRRFVHGGPVVVGSEGELKRLIASIVPEGI